MNSSPKIDTSTNDEMRLFSAAGERLYLNKAERERFFESAKTLSPEHRLFCHLLHDTGARISEILETSAERLDYAECTVTIRTIKQKRIKGKAAPPKYRQVPLSPALLAALDDVFRLRARTKRRASLGEPLWTMHRATGWRIVKKVMADAQIDGAKACPKGMRHAFGVACVLAVPPVPLPLIQRWLGHSLLETTAIYLQVVGAEEVQLAAGVWG